MAPKVLLRAGLASTDEIEAAHRHLPVVHLRTGVRLGDLVIPRYYTLPEPPAELEGDIRALGARLINPTRAHEWVADVRAWYDDLADLTPRTWFRLSDVPRHEPGSFVLKGPTSSAKRVWSTHMFARTRADVMPVAGRLMDDSLLGSGPIYVRQFERFRKYLDGVHGMPVTNEWRVFLLHGEPIASGYYWSQHVDEVPDFAEGRASPTDLPPGAAALALEVGRRIRDRIPFVVVDVAEREDGVWRVVELNDGCMSGLSCVDPETLYRALAERLTAPEWTQTEIDRAREEAQRLADEIEWK